MVSLEWLCVAQFSPGFLGQEYVCVCMFFPEGRTVAQRCPLLLFGTESSLKSTISAVSFCCPLSRDLPKVLYPGTVPPISCPLFTSFCDFWCMCTAEGEL